jgi:hypothetical protein
MIDKKFKGRIGKKKKLKLEAMKRTNQHFIEHLAEKMQELIIYRERALISTE